MAALVLAARGEMDADCFVWANVGDKAENPATLEYVSEVARPYAEHHGIQLVTVQREYRDGRDPDLLAQVHRDRTGVPIPMRMNDSGAPANRQCTYDWKIRPVARYLGKTLKWPQPWEVGLGISWDEVHRMSTSETTVDGMTFQKVFPLIDKKITVADCLRIVAEEGLPPAPKSSCWFCPFHSRQTWATMRLREPEMFQRAVALEQEVNAKRDRLGKSRLWLTDRLKPLDVAIPEGAEQSAMFDDQDAACTSGYCWT